MNRDQQAVDGLRREQAGRAAADEDAGNFPAPDLGHSLFQVAQQGVQISGLGNPANPAARRVGIEIAIGALAHAPGNMDVQGQGRRRLQAAVHDKRGAGLRPIIRPINHRGASMGEDGPKLDISTFLLSSIHDMKNSMGVMAAYLSDALASPRETQGTARGKRPPRPSTRRNGSPTI
jgi:hypothetical protein